MAKQRKPDQSAPASQSVRGRRAGGTGVGGHRCDAGVLVAETVDTAFIDGLAAASGLHRVWDPAPDVMAPAVLPSR